jgi:hypothetical protein
MVILSPITCNVSSLSFLKVISSFNYVINQGEYTDNIDVVQSPDCSKSIEYSFTIEKANVEVDDPDWITFDEVA